MAQATHNTVEREQSAKNKAPTPTETPEESVQLVGDEQALTAAAGDPDAETRHAAVLGDPRLQWVSPGQRMALMRQLQRGYGNSHVARVMARVQRTDEQTVQRCACGRPAGSEGMCDECRRAQQRKKRKESAATSTPHLQGIARKEELATGSASTDKPAIDSPAAGQLMKPIEASQALLGKKDNAPTHASNNETLGGSRMGLGGSQDVEGGATPGMGSLGKVEARTGLVAQEAIQQVDQGKVDEKKRELEPHLKPDEGALAQHQSQVGQVASKMATVADAPSKSSAEGAEGSKASTPEVPRHGDQAAGHEASKAAKQAASIAEQASAVPQAEPAPAPPSEVAVPEPAAPVDAKGEPLPVDKEADTQIVNLAQRAQHLRAQGQRFRSNAAAARSDAQAIRSSLGTARQTISQAGSGVQTASAHLASRREIVGQAQQALATSEQKAAMVAEQAPHYSAKADEGKEQSGPVASKAGELTAENSAKTPADPEAAGNAQQQGQKLTQVGSDATNIDNAVTQTRGKADTLGADAARATQMNAQTRGKIETMQATLGKTDEKISQMQEHNAQARAQVDELADQPGQMATKAESLDEQGQELITASQQIEAQLHEVQESYLTGMQAVPGIEPASPGNAPGAVHRSASFIQRAGYDDRASVNIAGHLPSWLTGQQQATIQQRQEASRREGERRRNQIAQINQMADGHFERLGPGDKALMALRLTGQNLFSSVSNINILEFGGHLLQGLVDPRMALSGVLGGLSMMASGAANLFSAEQWKKDPLGNLLKSAADIATGLTIILGSISGLAGVIIGLMTAISILSLGLATPITGPIIAFCSTVLAWTLPATIAVGKVALVLQALVLIKNLIDATTASTAEELQTNSDRVTEDVSNAGNVLMQVGGAKLGQKMMQHGPSAVPEEAVPPAPEVAPATEPVPTPGPEVPGAPESVAPEPAAPVAEPEPVAPGAEPEPAAPTTEAEPSAPAGEAEPAAPEAEPAEPGSEGRAAHPDEPQIEEGIVAKERTADGQHEVKVTQDGRLVRCSTCGEIKVEFEAELAENPELAEQLEAAEGMTDPEAKAAEAARIEEQLSKIRQAQQVEGGAPTEGGEPTTAETEPLEESEPLGEEQTESEPIEEEPTTPATPTEQLQNRIENLKQRAFQALERAEGVDPSNPRKFEWIARARELRESLQEAAEMSETFPPEEVEPLVPESDLAALENEMPEQAPREQTSTPEEQPQSEFRRPRSGLSPKEAATDIPSWAEGKAPRPGESGRDFARRLMREKYPDLPESDYDTGPGSEFNKLKKFGDRAFE